MVLDDALASLPIAEADLGLPWNWRIGPASQSVSDEIYVVQAFTPAGVGLRPFSVAHVEQPWRRPRTSGDLTAPPASPADGDRYIVASGATGDWAGWDLNVALFTDGAWLRLPPRTGWRAWVEVEALLLVYDGSGWVGTTPDTLQNLALLGLGATADASNPFSAKLNAALWTAKTVAEGGTGDLFYTMTVSYTHLTLPTSDLV